ncbi:hypothetical protein SARC_10889 [Sphaeroforma arctica JP610]|uniref:Uncharacterized protein n=1 Tax=Sphaeroforma arctica JP610 TaxID=667725 RepID=A0A0L0FIM1_9EUKA|nr:hypothetical protein SARC_10889 [Sphaeroforma arctica JP610]KNC76619.1 hypothetical protein SARC_10889 [Sphaeroforma arctica JP610]|eukprot:XP_014150521.1 hypothetical protein SARC_10889 [Sphaeroforma arctica JP610]
MAPFTIEFVYTQVFRDGEVITDNELLKSSHAYYDIPDASLAEFQADLSLLSGLTTNSMYVTSDCSGLVIATHTHPGEGDQLYTSVPLLDDPKLNIYCLIDQTAEGCVKTSGFFQRYISDDGVQIIVDDGSKEYEMAAYGAFIPSRVYGNASFKIHAGGHPIVEKE